MSDGSAERGELYRDLRARIASKEAVLIVGAGVSIGATANTQFASWKGLLNNGIDRCVEVTDLASAQAENLKRHLDSSDEDLWLSTAELIERKLKKKGGEFGVWLRDTVGSLSVSNPGVIEALAALELPIVTTNYDGVLEQVVGAPAITWRQTDKAERMLRGEDRAILHIHGHYDDPDSVVLGVSSYEDVRRDEFTQALLHSLRTSKTLVLVGFGKGLRDPNFGAFLRWSQRVFASSPYRHYRLAREEECGDIEAEHPDDERIFVLPYGSSHGDLQPFIESLAGDASDRSTEAKPTGTVPSRVVTQESFHAEIDLAKQHTKDGMPDIAIAMLDKLRIRHHFDFDDRIWYRLLANLAHAYEEKEEFEKAASLYLQAKDYQPDDVDARCYEAAAYFLRGEVNKARALAEHLRSVHATSSLAHAVWTRAAPRDLSFLEIEDSVPQHLRGSLDVAHALMFAALARHEFEHAEHYARITLEEEPDSATLLEQAGGVFLEHARHTLRDINAEIPPSVAKHLSDEAARLYQRALQLREKRGQLAIVARLNLGLGLCEEILGNQEAATRRLSLAYNIDPHNRQIVTKYAVNLAAREEFSAAIVLVTALLADEDDTSLQLLLSDLQLERNEEGDQEAARQQLRLVASDRAFGWAGRFEAARKVMLVVAESEQTEAEDLLTTLSGDGLPDAAALVLRSTLFRRSDKTNQAEEAARQALDALTGDEELFVGLAVARQLTFLGLFTEASPLWQRLVQPNYLGRDTQMAVAAALTSDDAEFLFDFCARLRASGIYDRECIRAELEALNNYNCPDTIEELFYDCETSCADEGFLKELRVSRSLLGLELAREEWICNDLTLLPNASDASPAIGRAVVQILGMGLHPNRAVEYAYELLRNHFESKDANIAVIGSLLIAGQHEVEIPDPEIVEPGVAVAYREHDDGHPRWWIIEDGVAPCRARRELSPEHPLAQKMHGKKAGDSFAIREHSLQDRIAKVVELQSKYVYRFQQCMGEFEEFFPGANVLMQFSTKREDTDDSARAETPDFSVIQRSVDERINWVQAIERDYTTFPSTNWFAQRTQTHVIDAMSHLAAQALPIRCCVGDDTEFQAARDAILSSSTIVLDGSALALLFLTRNYRHLQELGSSFAISYGTYRALRRLYIQRLNSGEQGFLTKVGDQLALREQSARDGQQHVDELGELLETVEAVASIHEGRTLLALPLKDRARLEETFGRDCGESIGLARQNGWTLWVDDLQVARLASQSYQVSCAWTQVVFGNACDRDVLEDCVLHSLTVRLLKHRCTVTRITPSTVLYVGQQAGWSTENTALADLLSWFSNADVAPVSLAWVASNSIRSCFLSIEDESTADAVVLHILQEIRHRHDGDKLLKGFRDEVKNNWPGPGSESSRLAKLIDEASL